MTTWVALGTLVGIVVAAMMLMVLQTVRRLAYQLDEQRIGAGVLEAATTHAIIATDRSGVITLFSRGAEQMLGYAAHEVIGRLRPDAFHLREELEERRREMGVAHAGEIFAQIARARLPLPERWNMVHRSGRQIPVVLSFRRLTNRRGQATGYVAVGRDISAELRIKTERDQFFSLPLEMLCVVDTTGHFISVNGMFTVCLGYRIEEMVGRPLFDFLHPDDLAATRQELTTLAASGSPAARFVNRYRHADGSYRWLSWVSSPDKAAGRIYGAARDITEQRRIKAELEGALTFERQLLGIVSHDLRNPIAAILMVAERMRGDAALTAGQARSLGRIEGAASRAERLALDLLDVTRAQLGDGMEVRCGPHDLVAIARETAAEVGAAHPGRRVDLRGPDTSPCEVDAHRVAQALTNLLVNALRHGDPDQPVTIRVDAEPAKISLTVHNFGPAISREMVPQLFEAMRQHKNGGPEGCRGSLGLGLFIVDQVARAHGGEVEVTSAIEDGTAFRMLMPRYTRMRAAETTAARRNNGGVYRGAAPSPSESASDSI